MQYPKLTDLIYGMANASGIKHKKYADWVFPEECDELESLAAKLTETEKQLIIRGEYAPMQELLKQSSELRPLDTFLNEVFEGKYFNHFYVSE